MTSTATAKREQRIRTLTELVQYFDPTNSVHLAHFKTLRERFGELWAAMIVSQDAARDSLGGDRLEVTDPGEINSHAGWSKLNRVVRHGSKSAYTVFDFDAETNVGGRIIPLFTRDQTVPAYEQTD
jgi:hypothetical protein